jgi:DNA helicase-2/ATP-dependent DNA helicase PcrA
MSRLILADLNAAQKEAVTWGYSPLLVLAGAGSGKTRILTHRIAYLVSQGVPSFHILGVTFTNKAAGEMKARVQKLVRHEVWVSTFHATCLRILRSDGPAIGLDRRFTIYDEHDQLVVIKECLKELNIDEKQVHPKGVRERIQRAKDFLLTPFQYAEKAPDVYEERVAHVYELYEKKLASLKAADFGDLIMKTVDLFDKRPEVLKAWQDRFQHILIDEYQDTNHAQYRLVRLLAQARRQITVVGDPDQSIYAWRGADIRNILNFEVDYPDCGMIKMERNYRSTPVLLEAANELIRHNEFRKPKALWTERKGGEKISIFEALNEKEEAQYMVHQVLRAKNEGKSLGEQVVFYRVHAQSRVLEDALRGAKIPYKIVGGIRFYDRKEIKDLIAYLRAVVYPHDEVGLKRILNVPSRGIGKKALEILEEAARGRKTGFDQILKDAGRLEGLSVRVRNAIADFYGFLSSLRREQRNLDIKEVLKLVLEKTGYLAELEAERTVEAQARIENIEEFFSVVEDFEDERDEKAGESPLEAFLESISLMTDLDTWENGVNALTLMTLHTAKGLEFSIVYMAGMEEGVFPHRNALTKHSEDLEEERRLCYVGITRAKEKLHLTYARERRLYGSRQFNLPSRFLNEIPAGLFKSEGSALTQADKDLEDLPPQSELVIDVDSEELRRRILFD